jgi:leucyl aminopeptidase (aminopeptidase T)
VVADDGADDLVYATALAEARAIGNDVVGLRIQTRRTSGAEPPPPVRAAMEAADVCLCITERSLFHSDATGAAMAAGTRGVFNSPASRDAWENGAMQADFFEIRERGKRVAQRLRGAREVHVTSPAGTDVVVGIHGREPRGWLTGICHEPGQVSAYPGGEVSFPPMEGTSHGVVVLEHVMTDLGRLSGPIAVTIEEGEATEITGGSDADRLREYIRDVPNARNFAELGIGLNPAARLNDDITESKKRLGTAHVALGDSASGYGGTVQCDVHLDAMILDVTIEVDGARVVDDGHLSDA